MGKPIKDRGIRWVEQYGDKSAYLKQEMEAQVGRGSYFRWEGHDSTTSTDYYVVVSPGYSKKLGYYFFAGLRKMPADQGSSGKKFKNQAEAISYAIETWGVPRPLIPPAKAYNVKDIVNVPIVLEPQHDSKSAASNNPVVTAMSMAKSANVISNFVPRSGAKSYPEMLCWAYKASAGMGFLSAMNTRKRFIGTDVVNLPASGPAKKVFNEFTGQVEDAPLAPIYATCENPHPEVFKKKIESGTVDNPLIDIKRKNNKIVGYEKKPTLRDEEGDDYRLVRWKNVRIYPEITLPSYIFYGQDSNVLWNQLQQLGSAKRPAKDFANPQSLGKDDEAVASNFVKDIDFPSEITNPPERKGNLTKNVNLRFGVSPELYDKFVSTIATFVKSKGAAMMPPKITNQVQKNLVDILAFHKEQGQELDWNTPYFELMTMKGSQMMVYDSLGIPMGLRPSRRSSFTDERKQGSDTSDATYVLRDPATFIANTLFPPADPNDPEAMPASFLPQLIGEMSIEHEKTKNPQLGQSVANFAKEASEAMRVFNETQDPTRLMELTQKAQTQLKSNPIYRQDFEKNFAEMEKTRSELNKIMETIGSSESASEGEDEIPANDKVKILQHKLLEHQKAIDPILRGFRILAAHNVIPISHEDVADSRTCPPVLSDMMSQSYETDSTMLPTKGGKLTGTPEKSKRRYAPPFLARAKKEKLNGQEVHAARRFDPTRGKDGEYVYGQLPADVQPIQGYATGMSGLPVVVEDPTMYFPGKDGLLHNVEKSRWSRFDANGKGKFIVGGTFDINITPPGESSKKMGNKMLAARLANDSFIATQQQHCVRETSGYVKNVRQYPSEPLITPDPRDPRNQDYYTVSMPDGSRKFVGDKAEKRSDKYVHFSDTYDLMKIVSRQLGLDPADVGPFTPMTGDDIRIVYDLATEGIHYYDAIETYKRLSASEVGKRYLGITDPSQVPEQEKEQFLLFRDGQQFAASLDQNKYNYGKVCKSCGSGNEIKPEIIEEMNRAIQDPKAALAPKPGALWVIEYTKDGQNWSSFSEGDALRMQGVTEDKITHDQNFPLVFGSKMMAERHLSMPEIASLVRDGAKVSVSSIETASMTPHADLGNGQKTVFAKTLETKIEGYKQGKTTQELEPKKEDRFRSSYATADDLPPPPPDTSEPGKDDPVIEEQNIQDLGGVDVAVSPETPVHHLIPDMEDVKEPEPVIETPPVQSIPEPAPVPAPQPVTPPVSAPIPAPAMTADPMDARVKQIMRQWRGKTPDEMKSRAKAYEKDPSLYQRIVDNIGTKPATASVVVTKLVALANRLDSQGRIKEADKVDLMIEEISNAESDQTG